MASEDLTPEERHTFEIGNPSHIAAEKLLRLYDALKARIAAAEHLLAEGFPHWDDSTNQLVWKVRDALRGESDRASQGLSEGPAGDGLVMPMGVIERSPDPAVYKPDVVDFVRWLHENDFGSGQGYPQGIRGMAEELARLSNQAVTDGFTIGALKEKLEDTERQVRVFDEAHAAAERTIKRWEAATGCATPEEAQGLIANLEMGANSHGW